MTLRSTPVPLWTGIESLLADMYPYHFASGGPILPITRNAGWAPFHLPNDMEPFKELRAWLSEPNLPDEDEKALRKEYVDELEKALSDDSKRQQIRQSVLEGSPHRPSSVALAGWDSYLVVVGNENAHLIGEILSDIAEEAGRDPFDVVAEARHSRTGPVRRLRRHVGERHASSDGARMADVLQ